MQYHHHGYVARGPLIKEAAGTGVDRAEDLPDEMDVLIIGAGPAGIIQAAQLTNYPSVHTRIIDSRPGRLEVGRADGLWGRSSETFQAFDFYERLNDEAHRLVDVHFCGPSPDDPAKIARGVRAEDPPSRVTEYPFLIVTRRASSNTSPSTPSAARPGSRRTTATSSSNSRWRSPTTTRCG